MEKNISAGKIPLIQLKDIYKIYQMGDEEVRASDGISLTIEKGEFVAIVGKSGSGKSTLMNIIGALDVPTEGEYLLDGQDVSDMTDNQLAQIRNTMIGFVFQQYNLLPKLNLLENVELPLLYAGMDPWDRRERAMESLERVGLKEKWRNFPKQLSGGQQQRVSIARALAGNPSLILADEPTGALDSKTGREVLDFLKKLNREGNTIVMITHDSSIALEAERVVRIIDGRINFDGDVKESQFDIPDGYTSTSEADTSISSTSTEKNNSSSDTSTEKNNSISGNSTGITDKEIINEEGGYSFKTADYNIISKNGEVTTVYTNSKEQVPYFNVVTLKKESGDTIDEHLDRLSEVVMDKYKNRIASPPVKVSAQLTGRTAYGIEYSYSTEDGKNTIKVSHYVDDLGDAWASWAAVYYPGDAVTLSELQEAMDSLIIQEK